MRNLFLFIYRNNFFVVFLLLEVICALLIMRNNGYQGSSLINSANEVSASVYSTATDVKEYLLLKNENEKLALENAKLYNLLKSGYAALPMQQYRVRDTLYKQQYLYITAKAVNSSINRRSNYLTLNIGTDMGLDRDMAVVNSEGIVGVVKDVSKHFASVMSILHKDVKISCQLKRDGSYGPLIWDGSDYRYCLLRDIPTHAKIKPGDTVVTSAFSSIFPQGIMVGRVESFERRQNEPFYTVKVLLNTDFKKIDHVYVIKYYFKTEKDSLEAKSQTESDN